MKRNLYLLILAVFGVADAAANGFPWVAAGGPNGIYVNLGNQLPGRGDVAAYVLERREIGGPNWDTVLRKIEGPKDAGEFSFRLKDAERVIAPAIPRHSMEPLALWNKVRQGGTLNSLKQWGGALAVRMALGVTILDSTAGSGTGYEYRVTALQQNGQSGEVITSQSVLWPGTAPQIGIKSIRRENDEQVIRIAWSLGAARAPALAKLLRGESRGPLSFHGKADLMFQQAKGDSLTLLMVDTAITPGALYRYSVATWDYYGNPGLSSDTVLAAALPFHRVALPHHIKVESSDSLHGLLVQWRLDDPKNIQNVKLWRSRERDSGFSVLVTLPSSTTRFADQTAEPMQKYFYCLTITGALGEESPRSARAFGIFEDHTPPLAPGLRKGPPVKYGVSLMVTRNDRSAAAFRIYRCSGLGTPFAPVSALLPFADSEAVFADTSRALKPFLAYGYTVRAENAAHTAGLPSDTVYAQAAVPAALQPPPALTAKIDDGNRISLFWPDAQQVNPGMSGYLVYRKTTRSAFEPVDTVPLSPNHNWYSDSTVEAGMQYDYIVKSVDAASNQSPASVVASIRIPRRLPLPPSGVRALVLENGIRLSFDEPLDTAVAGYRIYRYERGAEPVMIAELEKGRPTFTDTQVPAGGLRFYFVTSMSGKDLESERSGEAAVRR